jgi:SHS2 domain-containing protein
MKKYEVIDHTADVGIRAFGKDMNNAFENAALGMFSIITDLDKVHAVGEFSIKSEALDIEQLLVDWLSELLYLHAAFSVIFSRFTVNIQNKGGKWQIEGTAIGEELNLEKHPYYTEIKAVTHHILKVEDADVCRVQVLFDI